PYVDYLRNIAVPAILREEALCIASIFTHPDQMVPLITLIVALRDAVFDGHITLVGNLEDQVTFGRFLRFEHHPDYERLFRLIDSIVLYDAEVPLTKLVKALKLGTSTHAALPNVVSFGEGRLVPPAGWSVTDLDAIPTPDYDG